MGVGAKKRRVGQQLISRRNFARKRLLECSYSVKCNGSQTICHRTRAMDLVVCAGCNCVLGSRPMLGRCFHIPSRLIVFSSYYIAVLYESTLMSKLTIDVKNSLSAGFNCPTCIAQPWLPTLMTAQRSMRTFLTNPSITALPCGTCAKSKRMSAMVMFSMVPG